jgi:hypothetical protein
VGQSDVTSDYWQGDEGKWQKTFGTGDANAIFVDIPAVAGNTALATASDEWEEF